MAAVTAIAVRGALHLALGIKSFLLLCAQCRVKRLRGRPTLVLLGIHFGRAVVSQSSNLVNSLGRRQFVKFSALGLPANPHSVSWWLQGSGVTGLGGLLRCSDIELAFQFSLPLGHHGLHFGWAPAMHVPHASARR